MSISGNYLRRCIYIVYNPIFASLSLSLSLSRPLRLSSLPHRSDGRRRCFPTPATRRHAALPPPAGFPKKMFSGCPTQVLPPPEVICSQIDSKFMSDDDDSELEFTGVTQHSSSSKLSFQFRTPNGDSHGKEKASAAGTSTREAHSQKSSKEREGESTNSKQNPRLRISMKYLDCSL